MSRNKVFSAINIVGLALSMACCLVISVYIWNALRFDSFHRNSPEIYRITEKQNQAGTWYQVAVTPGPLAAQLKADFPEVLQTVRFGNWSGMLKHGDHVFEEKSIQLTDNSVFTVFDFELVKGNRNRALAAADEIVLTERAAEKYFGTGWRTDPALFSKTFRLNDQTDFRLAGIVKDPPLNSSIQFDILLPLTYLLQSDPWSDKWSSNNFHTYVQLKPGTDAKVFARKIENRLKAYAGNTTDLLALQPLSKQYLESQFDFSTDWGKRSKISYIHIFTSVGLLLLLIACVNFVNLSTARSLKRSLEVGLRKVNGASRRQLVLQFLSESLLMAFVAGGMALFLIYAAEPFLERFTGTAMDLRNYSSPILLFFFLFVFITGLLAGIYPAFVLSAGQPASVFRKTAQARSGKRFRQGLVVFQFAIAVILMTSAYLMYRQLGFIQEKDLGFEKEQLLTVRLTGDLKDKSALFSQALKKLSGVKAAAPATMGLLNVDNSSYLEWEGMQPGDKFLITQANVDPHFIPALNLRLLSGTNFSPQKTNDTANFIINEAAVKRMGYDNNSAIGKQVDFWGAKGSIIGVVNDFHFKPLTTPIDPFILRYQPADRYFTMFVKLASGSSRETINQIAKLFKEYDKEAVFEYSFFNDALNRLYEDDNRTASIILLFAALTTFVGCLGLFGLVVFSTSQRLKEIGIRKVLGAAVHSIVGLLLKDFLRLVLLATVLATPVAWVICRKWLQSYAYRTSVDWWVFAVVGLTVAALATFTISFHALKAASANPVKSLRNE